jgi:hypothetical protein
MALKTKKLRTAAGRELLYRHTIFLLLQKRHLPWSSAFNFSSISTYLWLDYKFEEVCCFQVNDAADSLRLVIFVSKVQGFYIQITEQTGWGRGERRVVQPLWLAVLADGDLHCNENPIYTFLFWELRGLSPNFHIHVSVSDLYIPRICHIFSCRRSWKYINLSQIYECRNWEIEHDNSV